MIKENTTKAAPILEIAWLRHAQLDASATNRTHAFFNLRRWITLLGVLATLFAILVHTFFSDSQAFIGLIVKIFFVATPVLASIFAAFASKYYSNDNWLIYRAGAEEIKKEIYLYRTILQKNKSRRTYLEKRLAEIQRQIYRNLSGEFAFEAYNGPVPPHYNPEDPNSDSGFHDLTGEEYFKWRLKDQLAWHNKKIIQQKAERRRMTIFILGAGGLGAVFAAWGGSLSIWVALTASITAALIGWQELRNVNSTIRNYSKVVVELIILHDHWHNLEVEDQSTAEFYKMVRNCENVLWSQNMEYVKSMQDALKESDLEEEADLINRVIQESVESDAHLKQSFSDAVVKQTSDLLTDGQEALSETFKETLGTLAEEASSEMVQAELAAMGQSAAETAQNIIEHVPGLQDKLKEIADELGDVEIGKDTPMSVLNSIMSRYPKSGEIKG